MEKFDSRIGDCHSNDDVLKIAAVLFLTCDSHYRCGISLCLSFWDKDVVGVIMYDHPLRNDV